MQNLNIQLESVNLRIYLKYFFLRFNLLINALTEPSQIQLPRG